MCCLLDFEGAVGEDIRSRGGYDMKSDVDGVSVREL